MASSPSPPPPPDYTKAAQVQGAANLDVARTTAAANRVNQVTPEGTLTWSHNPLPGQPDTGWTSTQAYSPEQKGLYTGQTRLSQGLLDTANTSLPIVQGLLSNPSIDQSRLPPIARTLQRPGETYIDAVGRLMQPNYDRAQASLRTRLANEGFDPGSEGYKAAERDLSDLQQRGQLQAIQGGIGYDQAAQAQSIAARNQGIQEQTYFQDRPLNILNALRTGSQVSTPQFGQVPLQGQAQAGDFFGAAQGNFANQMGIYNAGSASASNTNNALIGGGAAVAGAGLAAAAPSIVAAIVAF